MIPIRAVVYGDAGHGKSWLGASCPGPRLVLDAEKGSHFARRTLPDGTTYVPHQLHWDPHYALPEGITTDTTVIINISCVGDVDLAYRWLASGQHPFRSVIVDSLSDLQLRAKQKMIVDEEKEIASDRIWGKLLDTFVDLCQRLMDLTTHSSNPLASVVVLSGAQVKDGKFRPMVQGALAVRLPGYPDLLGFMEAVPNPLDLSSIVYRLHIQPGLGHLAKDRTHFLTEAYPAGYIDNPSIEDILHILNPPTEVE